MKKLKIELHRNHDLLANICIMVANHNGGKANINNDVIGGYILASKANYTNSHEFTTIQHDGDVLHIFEKEECCITITEIDCLPLNEVSNDTE